jgi:hypothetical protein
MPEGVNVEAVPMVQIAVAVYPPVEGWDSTGATILYGLGHNGVVYGYDFDDKLWRPLSTRTEAP